MKKILLFTITLAVLMLTFGCGKNNSPQNFYDMNATINGAYNFKADGPSKAYITGSASGGMEYTDLFGKTNDGKVIQIRLISASGIPLPRGVSIPVNTGQMLAYYYPNGFDSTYTYGVTGSVVLNAVSPSYQGSFSFTCSDSTRITAGTFNIKAP